MAHFAELNNDNIVIRVIVINNQDIVDETGRESESKGILLCESLFGGRWVQTSINNSFRSTFAGVGMHYCSDHDVFSATPCPGEWAYLDKNGLWKAPAGINLTTGNPITDEEWKYIRGWTRHTRGFALAPAILNSNISFNQELHKNSCVTVADYSFPTFEVVVHGKSTLIEILQLQAAEGVVTGPIPMSIKKVIDLTPYAIVTEGSVPDPNWIPENGRRLGIVHPQIQARTAHELFRLIIEWGFTYTDFGNRELVAEYCHNVLRLLQMPLNVRNDLLEQVPPNVVERYILGLDPFVAQDELDDPPCPDSFTVWYSEISSNFPEKKLAEEITPIDWDTISNDYPR
jgi:hypothetical protein